MELPLRIVFLDPPPGVLFALQRGRVELEQTVRSTGAPISFEFSVRVRETATGRVLGGPYCQGPPGARFAYISSGARAGDRGSCWDRRAKVPLGSLPLARLAEVLASPGLCWQARIAGTGRDGGPACATVPLLGVGWELVPHAAVSPTA